MFGEPQKPILPHPRSVQKWAAQKSSFLSVTVQQEFSQSEGGSEKTWRVGEQYELKASLKPVGSEWKIIEF
jgi:hypothetical protein